MQSRRPGLRPSLCGSAAGLLLLLAAGSAQARTEQLRWIDPNAAPSPVTGFRIHSGPSSQAYDTVVDVGLPNPDPSGVYSFDLEVPDQATVFVALSAYDVTGGESQLSNEKVSSPSGGGPPPSGGQTPPWSQDFEALPLGSSVADWVDTGAGNSLTPDDTLFGVLDVGGNQVLGTTSELIDIHSHLVAAGSASWSAYEIRGRLQGTSVWSRLGVTAYSGYLGQDVYYRLGSAWLTGEIEIFGHPWSTPTCTAQGTGVAPTPGTWLRFRFQVEPEPDRTVLRAKAWPDGTAEPAGWQAECTDPGAGRPAAGSVGVWSGANGAKYWDDLEVVEIGGPLGAPGKPALQP